MKVQQHHNLNVILTNRQYILYIHHQDRFTLILILCCMIFPILFLYKKWLSVFEKQTAIFRKRTSE